MEMDNDVSSDLAAIEALESDVGDIERQLSDLEQAPVSPAVQQSPRGPHGAHDLSPRDV